MERKKILIILQIKLLIKIKLIKFLESKFVFEIFVKKKTNLYLVLIGKNRNKNADKIFQKFIILKTT